MKKILYFVFSLVVLSIAISACDNEKTPQELLKEENKAIDRFIAKNGLTILKKFPTDGVFGEKEYFHDASGLYIRIVNMGDTTNRAKDGSEKKGITTVIGRYRGRIDIKRSDTTNTPINKQPDEFIYGRGVYPGNSCSGWYYAAKYVGDDSEVSLIIPSKLGTSLDNQDYAAVYFESLKFSFDQTSN